MGEIAELMVEGILCVQCGVFLEPQTLDDEGNIIAPGHPRVCRDCKRWNRRKKRERAR